MAFDEFYKKFSRKFTAVSSLGKKQEISKQIYNLIKNSGLPYTDNMIEIVAGIANRSYTQGHVDGKVQGTNEEKCGRVDLESQLENYDEWGINTEDAELLKEFGYIDDEDYEDEEEGYEYNILN